MSLAIPQSRPAFVLSDISRAILTVVAAICFALPLKMAGVGEFEIPLAMVMVVLGLPALFTLPKIENGKVLLSAMGLAMLSLCVWDLSPQSENSFRPYFSYTFFFIPFVTYALGYSVIRKREEFRRFVSLCSFLGALAGIGMAITIWRLGIPVRMEGVIQGSLLGLPLYATYGVNTLAITEFVMFAFIWTDLVFSKSPKMVFVLVKLAGLACLTALILLSLSRGGTLSLAVFVVLTFGALLLRNPQKAVIILAAFVVGGMYIVARYGDVVTTAWSVRFSQSATAADEGDVNDLTSGRLTLVNSAVGDVLDNPLFGVGFTGFHTGRENFSQLDAQNSSPHDQYLTMVWKPGVPAGLLLIWFVIRNVGALGRLRKKGEHAGIFSGLWCMTLAMLLIAALTWDVLLVPNLGAWMMFIFGAASSIEHRERQEAAAV